MGMSILPKIRDMPRIDECAKPAIVCVNINAAKSKERRGKVGSKSRPSKYDCFSKAEPDEPMFVLLGRDPCAPILIDTWCELRKRMGEDFEKLDEARACAEACEQWLGEHDKGDAYKETLLSYQEVIKDELEEVPDRRSVLRVKELEMLVREMREHLVWCKGKMAVPATDWFKGPQLVLEHSLELVP
jgi:hypothetical protein